MYYSNWQWYESYHYILACRSWVGAPGENVGSVIGGIRHMVMACQCPKIMITRGIIHFVIDVMIRKLQCINKLILMTFSGKVGHDTNNSLEYFGYATYNPRFLYIIFWAVVSVSNITDIGYGCSCFFWDRSDIIRGTVRNILGVLRLTVWIWYLCLNFLTRVC